MTEAAAVSAAKPSIGWSFASLVPIVLMIRQPPAAVPQAMAVAAIRMTQTGTSKVGNTPCANSARVMMPIVFCASFVPCASASRPPDASCPSLKPPVTGPGRTMPTTR
jgi:hypothetical protein